MGATIADGSATGTITNDDAPPPTLSIADVTVAEGNAGTSNAGFIVTLSAQPGASTVTVNYATANGTRHRRRAGLHRRPAARSPSPARPPPRPSPSRSSATPPSEPTETFTVTLSVPVGATITDGSATGTITNDDARRRRR